MEQDASASASALAASSSAPDRRRLGTWALLCLFSTLCLTAHETDDNAVSRTNNILITTLSSVSLALSALATFANITSSSCGGLFVGTFLEGLAALVAVGLWAAALPIIMNPTDGLAQMYVGKAGVEIADYQATIANANLYFSSWGAGVCALSVLAMYVRARLGGGGGGAGLGHTAKWYLLMLASVVVIVESVRFRDQVCTLDNGTEEVTCGRNIYGLATGITGLAISFVMSLFSSLGRDSALVTSIFGFVMAVLYTLCAGLLTFDNGPATYVGNHFFSAWAGFFVSFALFGNGVAKLLGVGGVTTDGGGEGGEGEGVEMDNI